MTFLTFASFFTFVYGWIGFWCILTFILMMSRRGKNWADYDVILFRFAVGGTTASVFVNRFFNDLATPREPVITPFLWMMVFFHIILVYAAAATAIRVIIIIVRERWPSIRKRSF